MSLVAFGTPERFLMFRAYAAPSIRSTGLATLLLPRTAGDNCSLSLLCRRGQERAENPRNEIRTVWGGGLLRSAEVHETRLRAPQVRVRLGPQTAAGSENPFAKARLGSRAVLNRFGTSFAWSGRGLACLRRRANIHLERQTSLSFAPSLVFVERLHLS